MYLETKRDDNMNVLERYSYSMASKIADRYSLFIDKDRDTSFYLIYYKTDTGQTLKLRSDINVFFYFQGLYSFFRKTIKEVGLQHTQVPSDLYVYFNTEADAIMALYLLCLTVWRLEKIYYILTRDIEED
jgi:hypothetical protein